MQSLQFRLTRKQRRAVFQIIDEDGSGDLAYSEITKEIKKAGKHPPPKAPETAVDQQIKMVPPPGRQSRLQKGRKNQKEEKTKPDKRMTAGQERAQMGPRREVAKTKDEEDGGPPKLTSEAHCSKQRRICREAFKAYLEAHHSAASFADRRGLTVLHSLHEPKVCEMNVRTHLLHIPVMQDANVSARMAGHRCTASWEQGLFSAAACLYFPSAFNGQTIRERPSHLRSGTVARDGRDEVSASCFRLLWRAP